MKYFTDGSGTNGTTSSYCVLSENGDVITHVTIPGNATNNEMEYRAMIEALNICKDNDIIFSDSQLIVYQLTGVYKIKEPRLKILAMEAFEIMKNKKVKIEWLRRENNIAGIFLEKNH
jgi:ribonuclease HI